MAFTGFHGHFEESMDDYFQGGDEERSVEGINRNLIERFNRSLSGNFICGFLRGKSYEFFSLLCHVPCR